MKESLFHISEDGNIKTFFPKPSPSKFKGLESDVVFAISGRLLHNYLLPRDCPRVCYYATAQTTMLDKGYFLDSPDVNFVIAVEEEWVKRIEQTELYCYQFPTETFELLDEIAGYYFSCQPVIPISVTVINNPYKLLLERKNIELRILPTLRDLAGEVSKSSLAFSLIRMRNAK